MKDFSSLSCKVIVSQLKKDDNSYMTRMIIGYVICFGIGFLCRIVDLPLPAPPIILGAMIVVVTSLGYSMADKHLTKKGK